MTPMPVPPRPRPDVVTFLRARYDEQWAKAVAVLERWVDADGFDGLDTEVLAHVEAHSPARVVADVTAKRRILDGMQPFGGLDNMFAPEVFAILASEFADHPDYRQEWPS